MEADRFTLLCEGWKIIQTYEDSRQSARFLCRWIADILNAAEVVLEYHSLDGTYSWKESVIRVGCDSTMQTWEHRFPHGSSLWFFKGGMEQEHEFIPLLDMLSELWLRFADRIRKKPKHGIRIMPQVEIDPDWIAVSSKSQNIQAKLPRFYYSSRPILIAGECGSGKRYLARLIHSRGLNPASPFVEYGQDGAYGTVYVSNWAKLSDEEKNICLHGNRRLIAALSTEDQKYEDSWKKCCDGDGFFVRLPPLRERREDIPLLVSYFLNHAAAQQSRCVPGISTTALEALQNYSWLGNLRELEETITRVLLSIPKENTCIKLVNLPPVMRSRFHWEMNSLFSGYLASLEYEMVKEELRRQNGNIAKTAKALGFTAKQVSWRMKKYGIER